MLHHQEAFESALQRVADFMEHPPAQSSEDDVEFAKLLHEIELYRPALQEASADTTIARLGREADALLARAEEFQKRREAREEAERLMSFPQDGRGIGPTTGV